MFRPVPLAWPAALVAAFVLAAGPLDSSPSASPGAASAAPPASSEYVALGDSYAAGYGLPEPTGEPAAACGQSAEDYPHRVAELLRLDLTDVSCAGATTDDVLTDRQHGVPPQIDALSADTRTVTLSIGGNDSGLFGTAASCFALSATGPVVSGNDAGNCRSRFVEDGQDSLTAKVREPVAKHIASTLDAVHRAAPHAVVVVVGYLAIFPDAAHTPSGGCFRSAVDERTLRGSFPSDTFPFTDADVRYLHRVQQTLDQVTRSAVESAGDTYVSTLASSVAHTPCASSDPYVNGVQLSATSDLSEIDLVEGSLHPNDAGAAAMTTAAVTGIRDAVARAAASSARSSSPTPSQSPSADTAGTHSRSLFWGAATTGVVVVIIIAAGFVVSRRRRSPTDRGGRQ